MEQYFLPATKNRNTTNSKTRQEYHQINSELKDIAWKLYDLTCDFKGLQVDAHQLAKYGHYDRYEKHACLSSEEGKKEMKYKASSDEDVTESRRRRFQFDSDYEGFPRQDDQQGFSRAAYDGYGGSTDEDQKKSNGYIAADTEECKQKSLKDFDKTLASRRNKHESEDDFAKYKSRYRAQTQTARCYSKYESLSTQELEQKLREKLDLLQIKAKCLKENYCNGGRSLRESSDAEAGSTLEITKGKRSSGSCQGRSSLACCRGKRRMRNQHSPHRVYLDGEKTYVVDHNDSKVIFIPKPCEY